MATVVFIPFHWTASINATFALARRLQRRSHRILYLGIPDIAARVRSQGFEFLPAFESVFPQGALEEQYTNEANGRALGLSDFRRRVLETCALMEQGEIERALGALRPDLFVVASETPWIGIGAWKTGVPVVTFPCSLISVWDPAVPPFSTGLVPGPGLFSRLRTRWAWRRLFLTQKLLAPLRLKIFEDVKEFARRCGYPLAAIDFRVETWPVLRLPNLIFCPPGFDFSRQRPPAGTLFVEPSVDLERRDGELPREQLRDDRPLAYCALGTVAPFKIARQGQAVYQAFLDALARRPHWQGVMAIGRHIEAGALRCPPNVLVAPEIPQLEILERASLMVTHGGFNSVKECIFQGVPMVLLPIFYDQPGNAARAVHHGLGVKGSFAGASASTLETWMDTVTNDPGYKERVQRMSRLFREWEARLPGVELVERMAERR